MLVSPEDQEILERLELLVEKVLVALADCQERKESLDRQEWLGRMDSLLALARRASGALLDHLDYLEWREHLGRRGQSAQSVREVYLELRERRAYPAPRARQARKARQEARRARRGLRWNR